MINGLLLRNAIISGSNSIVNAKRAVDELNIFPVPDGDTGTNMSMTMSAAAKALAALDEGKSIGEVATAAASALLRGARGNSGVILSLLFRGFAQGLKGMETANGSALADALTLGVEAAYKAVMKPTEGTILTVARVAAEKARVAALRDNDAVRVWGVICDAAEEALATTPDLLPVLKRAGVVDAGGKGLCLIFRGMQSALRDGKIVALNESNAQNDNESESDNFKGIISQFDEVINFTYCTEFIVGRQNENDPAQLRAYLETIGDCVVVVDDEEIIKVHVHTDNPGLALTKAIEYGQFLTVKVENMREQNKNAKQAGETAPAAPVYCEPTEDRVGFVAVAAGDGLKDLFASLGCDQVVSGGQTMNPSTEDILAAVQAIPAKTVFVLPNNKNIIMAAEQVVPIADRRVVVLPTRTIPQGISAMLAYEPDKDIDFNAEDMYRAAEGVSSGSITYAARNSDFGGKKIIEGDILALDNGKLVFTDRDPLKATIRLAKAMVTRDTSMVTLIYGDSVSDSDAENTADALAKKLGRDVEVSLINGGQPVYHFLISIE